ncbi:GAF domain-containing protein [Thermosipho ferrireducens]|uniref:GAF domain-containing protein n=1 Tax=Thermosipho ferrireducens TaxID=2571116 RepID=A0ABX7S6Z6_9BACT|nr:GAF domain-containing protein [Thermosipho ferrireducens]QTA37382.1 GAF domain-containing protein [Thermosipho ferrireducens]
MRNIIENRVDEFMEMLRYDKSQWGEFWKKMERRFSPILTNYVKKFSINVEGELFGLERRSLDRFYFDFKEYEKTNKGKISERIRKYSEELELSREDFIIFIAVFPGGKDWCVVEGKKENVIFVNAYNLWLKNELTNLHDAVYQAIIHFRHGESGGNYYNKENLFQSISEKIESLSRENVRNYMKRICEILYKNIPYYDWVGFYMVNDENLLELTEFVGEPTEHVKIPIGKGICGQAAALKQVFLVQDVSQESNYLSCSPKVNSEIVVPIFKDGKVIGEIDIDSHYKAPFDARDKLFLETICEVVGKLWK